jgi:hypothetical protein
MADATGPPDPPAPPAKPFRCKGCGTGLGASRPRALDLGPVTLWRTVTFRCRACGREGRWSPTPRPPRVE